MTDSRQKWKQFTALSAEKATLSLAIEKSSAAKQEEFTREGDRGSVSERMEGEGLHRNFGEGVVCGWKPCTQVQLVVKEVICSRKQFKGRIFVWAVVCEGSVRERLWG